MSSKHRTQKKTTTIIQVLILDAAAAPLMYTMSKMTLDTPEYHGNCGKETPPIHMPPFPLVPDHQFILDKTYQPPSLGLLSNIQWSQGYCDLRLGRNYARHSASSLDMELMTVLDEQFPNTAFFWHPAAGIASLSGNLSGSTKDISGHLGSGLKQQACNVPGMPTLLHCPRPEKSKKETHVYANEWSQVYWTVNDQYRDMISSSIPWHYETGRPVMDHMSRLWILVGQQKRNWQRYNASVERQCKTRLVEYDRLPAEMWFEFLHKSTREEFMHDLRYSYSSAAEKLTHNADSYVDMRKEVDELLKVVGDMLATERIRVYKDSSLTNDIRSYFGYLEKKEKVNVGNHSWVVNLEELQPSLQELHKQHDEMLDKVVQMKLYINSDEVTRQQATAGKRLASVETVMEVIRKDVSDGGPLNLPVLRNASWTES